MLKLKLQSFGHLMCRAHSLGKTLMLGKIEGRRRRRGWDGWMASLPQWTWVWASSGRWWRTGRPGMLQSMALQGVGHNWATKQQHNKQQPKTTTSLSPVPVMWRWHFTALINGQGPDFEPATLTSLNTVYVPYFFCTIPSHTCYLPSQQPLILFPVSSFFSTLGWMAYKS